jgi:uncharacterized OsmC-like protein
MSVAHIREALDKAGKLITEQPEKAKAKNAPAPNPGWLFRAAVASCTTTAIAMRAAKQGISLTRLEITVESSSDSRGLLGLDEKVSAGLSQIVCRVRIAADGVAPERLRELAEWGDRHSPVACTTRNTPDFAIEVEVV